MRLLCIDPATTTGWCVLDFNLDDSLICIFDYGFFQIDTTSEYEGEHCIDMQVKISNLISKYEIDEVCLEDYFFSRKARQGANKNVYLRASIMMLCRSAEQKLHYDIINIYNWKKYINGQSRVPKEIKKKYKANANKMVTLISLYDNHDLKFPNMFMNSNTNRLVNFKMDIVDSIAIGMYHIYERYGIDGPVIDCTNYYETYNDTKLPLIYDYKVENDE